MRPYLEVVRHHEVARDAGAEGSLNQFLEIADPRSVERLLLRLDEPEEALEDLPEGPGVYTFLGVNRQPLYIGKARNLRDRVPGLELSVSATTRDPREGEEADYVGLVHVDYPWARLERVPRAVPELEVDLPATAIGKDYLGLNPVALTPSGTGGQVNVLGLAASGRLGDVQVRHLREHLEVGLHDGAARGVGAGFSASRQWCARIHDNVPATLTEAA